MKILIITQIYPGHEKENIQTSPFAVHYFAKTWQEMGHEVEVMRIWPYRPMPFSLIMNKRLNEYAYKETFKLDNVKIHRVPIKKYPGVDFTNSENEKIALNFQRKVSIMNPDFIISHAISPSFFIGLKLIQNNNIPMFLAVHKTDIDYLKNKTRMKKYKNGEKKLQSTFFRSPVLQKKYNNLIQNKNIDNNIIIPSGIEENEILSLKEFQNKGNKKTIQFIIVCNLIKLKRVDIIIEAIYLLKHYQNKIKLKIVGDGPERQNLENLVNEKGLGDRISFLGYMDRAEVLNQMFLSDIFVMVSSPETFGLVYVEAMAKGCIVIGSKGEGIDGIIRNEENGFLCDVDDVKGLSKIIENCILMSHAKKQALLEETYKTVKNLTEEKCAKHYLNEIIKRLR